MDRPAPCDPQSHMTDTNQTSPQKVSFDAKRAIDFARSELFERTFKEGMAMVEETAAYLDGPGRAASKRLSRAAALAYAATKPDTFRVQGFPGAYTIIASPYC